MSGDSLCGEHPEEKLRFVCVPCDIPICRDCKLTEHEGHRSIDIAKVAVGLKDKLVNHRSRLEHRLRVLEVVTAEVEEDQTAASQAQHELEKRIKDRVALVTSWLRQAEHAALSALKATAMKVDENLSSTSSDLHKRREEIRKMIAPISQMTAAFDEPDKLDHVAALLLERDMRTGRGKGENLEKLTEGLPTYSVKPTLRSDSGGLTEEMVRRLIGTPLYTQLTKSAPKVALSPLFRCCSASGACVNAICPMADGKVWVAHDVAEGTSREQRVALYSVEGTALREQKVAGRVSIARAYGDWVYVAGPSVKKMMDGQETRDAVSERSEGSRKEKSTQPKQSVAALSKLDIRFSIKASTSGSGSGSGSVSGSGSSQEVPASESVICTLEARALPLLWIVSQPSFSVSAELPQALDVDSTGQFFAVVVLKPAVELYRSCHPDPVAVYSPIGENFSPSDVCFHVLDGTEVLLVADWFNSALHVLSFHDGLRFQAYLGAGCPLMKQPTALTRDDDNRLWIGCKGGHLLMCVSVEDSSDEGEGEEEEEQREEKAEGDGDREKIAL